MDINDPRVAQALIDMVDTRINLLFPELLYQYKNKEWANGTVVTGGSGTTIPVYINGSTTSVNVKNPWGLTLTTGQLVVIEYPNGRNDGEKFIARIKT